MINNRNVSIIHDDDDKAIVLINDRKFRGLTKEDWKSIEQYLMGYIGDCYEISACSEKIYIDKDLPDEYANSQSRIALKGARKKAKAEAVQGIPELIKIATPQEPVWEANKEQKYNEDAKNGWYRYYVRFGLPVYNDGNKYLYDLTTLKKETSSPLES